MTSTAVTSIEIDLTFDRETSPATASQIRGGYRVTVDGTRVVRFHDESETEWREWQPAYFGEFLTVELGKLFDALLAIKDGEIGRYETAEASIESWNLAYAFERLSGEHVRVAARYRPSDEDSSLRLVPPSERGFVVEFDALAREAVGCGRAYIDFAMEFGHDPDAKPVSAIRERIDRLRFED